MGKDVAPTWKALVIDIEGTVTSISFVKDVLFPYANENVVPFLKSNHNTESLKKVMEDLRTLSNTEAEIDSDISPVANLTDWETIANNIKVWIRKDKKLTPLKELQGIMWEQAYVSGDIKGHIYHDVIEALETMNRYHVPIYVYSSGSVHAQKLLFGHTEYGDLTPLLSGYFDTKIGHKTQAASYTKISNEINIPPADILFLTDVEKEAYAAKEAGVKVHLVVREGNAKLSEKAEQDFVLINGLQKLICD
uniref:Enolase-phosphatase E1 n=1 Tax=Panagrellus redivivus TaxID=6233 RepID=A0A7E4UV74_PANRE